MHNLSERVIAWKNGLDFMDNLSCQTQDYSRALDAFVEIRAYFVGSFHWILEMMNTVTTLYLVLCLLSADVYIAGHTKAIFFVKNLVTPVGDPCQWNFDVAPFHVVILMEGKLVLQFSDILVVTLGLVQPDCPRYRKKVHFISQWVCTVLPGLAF